MNRLLNEPHLQAYFLGIASPIWVAIGIAVYLWVVSPL